MDTALWVVRMIKAEIRQDGPGDLSLNQVRALAVLENDPDCPLCTVADVLLLTPPSTSHLVDGLVKQGLVERRPDPVDRRQVRLRLTTRGRKALTQAFEGARKHLAGRLASLSATDRDLVARAMTVLRPLVAGA
jgi:DNA-binding MarR family transcriptional regulator